MTFPSFITTGPTRDITVQPLEYKALNLMPLIQMMQQEVQKAPTSSAKKNDSNDIKLEGRIGGVNQIMAEVNKAENIIKSGYSLLGDAFLDTPEYARAVRQRDFALNKEVENTLARETKNLDIYKEQIKGKGHLFHLPQYISSGKLKRAKDWQSVLEYGQSNEYYGNVGGEYIPDFDFTPVLFDMEDQRKATDELFKLGYLQSEVGWSELYDKIVGDTVGVVSAYTTETSKRNFQQVNEKGQPIGDPQALEYAHNEALSRALGGLDVTDPIVGGYLQNFFQIKAGKGNDPFRDYRNEKNIVTSEGLTKFFEDYSNYVQDDLQKQKDKRKIQETGSTRRETFNVSEEGTRGLALKKESELQAQAWTGLNESMSDFTDFGIDEKWFLGDDGISGFLTNTIKGMLGTGSGVERLDEKSQQYLYGYEWSPFYKQSVDGKPYYNLNEDVNWEKVKENIVKDAASRGIENPETYASDIIAKARVATSRFDDLRKDGKTFKTTGRYDFQSQYMRADQVPDWFNDAVNSKYLIGSNTEEMGANMFAKIGETYLMLNDIKGLKYAGTEGGIKMTKNTIPTNLYTRVLENGKEVLYNWSSDAWRKMDESKKDKIIALSQEQSKKDGRYGTMLLNMEGKLDNTIKKERAVPMDNYAEKVLSVLVNDPNASLNMIFASSGAYTSTGKFKAKTEKDIAKAFQGINIYAEMPTTYTNLDDKDKKAYRRVYNDIWRTIDFNSTTSAENIDKQLLLAAKKHLTSDEYKEFEIFYNKRPENLKKLSGSKSTKVLPAIVADFAIGKKLNYQNRQTVLQPIPVSDDGEYVNPIAKKQLTITPYTEIKGNKEEKGFDVYIEFDATGAAMKNETDPDLQKRKTAFHSASQLLRAKSIGAIKDTDKNNIKTLIKPLNR